MCHFLKRVLNWYLLMIWNMLSTVFINKPQWCYFEKKDTFSLLLSKSNGTKMDLTEEQKNLQIIIQTVCRWQGSVFFGGLFCCCCFKFNTLWTAEWQDSAFIGNIFMPGPCIHYWAVQQSWFARVNVLCNLLHKKSWEVAAHFRANFWVGVASHCV